jgi:sugar phosphate isomerase/epimerase
LRALKLGCHTIAFHSFSLEHAVDEIANLGYNAIELNAETNWALPHVTPQMPAQERRRIARLIRERGLEVSSICAHTSLIREGEVEGKASIDFMKGCIELAADFDTRIVHAISGPVVGGGRLGERREPLWELLVDRVSQLIDYSEGHHVVFAFEAGVNQMVATGDDMEQLTNCLGPKHLYVNLDPSHPVLYGEDPAELVRKYGRNRIVHVHAKDGKGKPGNFQFPPLGLGSVDFRSFFGALVAIGYEGYVSVEYEGELFGYTRDPVTALRSARDFLAPFIRSAERSS